MTETAEYGIQFDRNPTAAEIKNTIKMIKKIKEKSKNKRKGKYHSDETDNPNLSQALLSKKMQTIGPEQLTRR